MVRHAMGVVRRQNSGEALEAWIARLERAAPVAKISAELSDGVLFTFESSAFEPVRAQPVVGCGAIRNRAAVAAALALNGPTPSNETLLVEAYRRWGPECCKQIYGDWCLAAWDQEHRELFLARDHHGNSALYYQVSDEKVAFATSLPLLLALRLGPVALDPLYLAQVLMSWPAYHGEGTAYGAIKRVTPAHYVLITPERVRSQRYWHLDDIPPLHLAKREDYAAGFRTVFDTAVREALPLEGTPAVTLSSGLDSGSVTVTAAEMLAGEGRRLAALISTPVADCGPYLSGGRIGDELPLARITAAAAGNVDLTPVAGRPTPIAAIRRALEIVPSPHHAAANYYWLQDIYDTAAAHGCPVILTGQFGNSGMSWPGDVFSQPLFYQIRKLGWRGWTERRLKRGLPPAMLRAIRRRKKQQRWKRSAINPAFADALNLFERWLADPLETPGLSPRAQRSYILKPGRSLAGDLHAGFGAAAGIAVVDPTADPRVLEYSFAVPDPIFIDPETGTDRWLIRAAMDGRLPDAVRLNRRRGRQAADLVPRLRACRDEVEDALDACERGAAADYLDVEHMRRVWHRIETEDNVDVFHLAMTVLTRGIMAGLFVNGIGKRW